MSVAPTSSPQTMNSIRLYMFVPALSATHLLRLHTIHMAISHSYATTVGGSMLKGTLNC